MPPRPDSFSEDLRFKILRMLENNPECSQRDIAGSLGTSLGGVNYCLKALIAKGHVKMANFKRSNNKLGYAYVLTPSGISERALLTGRFLQRKMKEHAAIMAEIDALIQENLPPREQPTSPSQDKMPVDPARN
jgi:EPS-associated MarR family transcriptional regulator